MQIPRCLIILFLFFPWGIFSQPTSPKWDDTKQKDWPEACTKIEILSSLDRQSQPAYFFEAKGETPRPLIVSLHTWSGGYEQKDALAWMSIEKNYHYIHPHFRGPNNTPQACGSEYAIQDIEDAISYARMHANIDTSQIHIIGTSGGGYATLLMYMRTKHPIKTFSAWVPISDVEKWYYESVGRGNKYALDIAKATVGSPKFNRDYHYISKEEARKRSPFYMNTPVEERQRSKLYIYAGIHDGYTGSVPITQSLEFFNKVIADYDPSANEELIPSKDIMEMVVSRNYRSRQKGKLADRVVHYVRQYKDLVKISIFEGGHEMLESVALDHIESRKILVLGDSNGAAEGGWVEQLKDIRYDNFFYNTSISGNTIGFDNNGQKRLNTLRHIDRYVEEAEKSLSGLTDIIIMLGTNDCKAVFEDRLTEVPQNLETLIQKIQSHSSYKKYQPQIHIISPPPYGKDESMLEKYHGGLERVRWLQPRFESIAQKHGCTFIDVFSKLEGSWDYYAPDGIHPKSEAQRLIAKVVSGWLNDGRNVLEPQKAPKD